jgi:hypothetical protein
LIDAVFSRDLCVFFSKALLGTGPMATRGPRVRTLLIVLTFCACSSRGDDRSPPSDASVSAVNPEFAAVPESAWVNVTGPTLIAFHPATSNELLEKDQDLASALDDLAYHVGTAMDSLYANGFTVHYRNVDSVFLRSGTHHWKFTLPRDSSRMGYVFTDTLRRIVPLFGVRGHTELIASAHEFRQTGQVRPK